MPRPCAAGADVGYECMVAQLVTTPAPRLALLNNAEAKQSTFVQKVLEDSAVRAYFSNRCVVVSCDGATSAEAAIACLASGLGLEPTDNCIEAILEYLVAHGRTLIVFDNVEAIYSPTDPEQQEATDVLLATLAAVDEVTLVVTFCGTPLPDCVAWTSMDDISDDTPKSEPQASRLPQHMTAQAVVSPASPSHTMVTNSNAHVCESSASHTPARPLTIAQSKVPPPQPAVFHGRDKEVERLVVHSMVPSTAPIGIVGPGGIGKTALALNVLHDRRVKHHFSRQRLFLTCEGANSVDEVLFNLAGKLNVQMSQSAGLWPVVLDSLRARQRVLLVIDNFETIWSPTNDELRAASEVFLAQLAVLDEVTLLVTTRGNLLPANFTWANVDTAELDTLSSTAARLTFTDLSDLEPSVLESEPEASSLTELLREIDYMPLAIKLLARLRDLPSRLLREWSEHYTAVLEADRHDGSRRELSVEVSIKISLAHLAAESANFRPRHLLSVMGQLPAGLFPGVSADLSRTIPNLDAAAQDLLRHSLVYTGGYGELRMLSPVRHYVSESLPMSAATLSALEKIYLDIVSGVPLDRVDADGPAYDVELSNMFHVFAAVLDRPIDSFLEYSILKLASYCNAHNRPCLPLLQKLAPHVEFSPWVKSRLLFVMAGHFRMTGDLQSAVQSLKQSARLSAELGDKLSEAKAMSELWLYSAQQGRFEDAYQQKLRSEALFRESGSSDIQYWVLPGEFEDIVSSEQRFRDDREARLRAGDAQAFFMLSGLILDILETRHDEAAYIKELELVVALGAQKQLQSAHQQLGGLTGKLALMYLERGRIEGVEDLLIDAYALLSSSNQHLGMATVTESFATLRKLQGRFINAAELFEAAAKLFGEAGAAPRAELCDQEACAMRMHIATSD